MEKENFTTKELITAFIQLFTIVSVAIILTSLVENL